ncbi:hypothetical protein RDI58_008022 [Solanum bulbocastanum]|uniref:Cyanobacterial aminoacyl-tRNA synthetase CAAD domain-containing protein n=1 Tax=Solanum bulbocastanum TaxID=147425 RepID=A0AAN8TXF3_SOLBU
MATASSSSSMERIMSLPHSFMTMRLRHSNVPSLLRLSPQAARLSFSSSFRSPTGITSSSSSFFSGFRRCIGSKRSPIFKIRASFSDEETSESDTRIRKVFSNVKDTWDGLEKKPTVFVYGGSAILGLWLSSIIADALDSIPLVSGLTALVFSSVLSTHRVPNANVYTTLTSSVRLLPKFLELVGLGYFGWFVYRYLLFKSGRDELGSDIQALKKKITGDEEE